MSPAKRIRTGGIAINGAYPPFPLPPFGGCKQSGLGRELTWLRRINHGNIDPGTGRRTWAFEE